jgi:hypothetical protein
MPETIEIEVGHRLTPPDLRAVFEGEGPVISTYLQVPNAVEGARQQFERRLGAVRRRLLGEGHSQEAVERVVSSLHDCGRPGAPTVVAIGDADGIRLEGQLLLAIDQDVVVTAATPRTIPVIESFQRSLPYLVVTIDREGADILAVDHGDLRFQQEVEGETDFMRKVKMGGWSQPHYQRHAENTWEQNAKSVAEALDGLVDEHPAAFIAVAGEERAVGFLLEHLREAHRHLVRLVDGSRAVDGSSDDLADRLTRLHDTVVAERMVQVLERFKEAVAVREGTSGAENTLAALSRGQVDTLLVADDTTSEEPARAFVGDDPMSVTTNVGDILALDQTPRSGPQQDLAIAAALAGDAKVVVVPGVGAAAPAEGIGALLRYPRPPRGA